MRALRFILLGLIPLVALVSFLASAVRRSNVLTTDWRDLTVVGRGYIKTVDASSETPLWLRTVRLEIDPQGILCANYNGGLRPIEPIINVPSEWTQVVIAPSGQVSMGNPVGSDSIIGQMSLSLNYASSAEPEVLKLSDASAPLVEVQPGESGSGFLMQRVTTQRCIPIDGRTLSSIVLTIVVCAFAPSYLFAWCIRPDLLIKQK